PGGAMKAVGDGKPGAKHMDITSKTYWYVKKFLAHKIAFEGAVGGTGEVTLATLPSAGHRSLKEIARAASITEDELRNYNKWVRSGNIPDDKAYSILVPVNSNTRDYLLAMRADIPRPGVATASAPPVEKAQPESAPQATSTINGVPVIAARQGESPAALAKRAGISLSKFRRYNDLAKGQRLIAGEYYFTEKKKGRGEEDYHKLAGGESLWTVSQRHGIRLSRLLRFNRMDRGEKPREGTILYLTARKPADDRHMQDVVEVDRGSVFAWSVDPGPVSSQQRRVEPAPGTQAEQHTTKAVARQAEPVPAQPEATTNRTTVTVVEPDTNVSGSTATDAAPARGDKHEVLPGETLYAISRQYDVTVNDLVRWNNLDVDAGLKPGQVLVVKGEPLILENTETA